VSEKIDWRLAWQHKYCKKVADIIDEVLNSEGYELINVEFVASGKKSILRIYVDNIKAGITISELSKVTHLVSDILDVEDPIVGTYCLEVSSPGIQKPLLKRADFEEHLEELVEIKTKEKIDGQKLFKGKLVEVADDYLVLLINNDKKKTLSIGKIRKANLMIKSL